MNSRNHLYLGHTYLSAYSIAVKHGFVGSEQDWLDSLAGGRLEMKYFESDGVLRWRYAGAQDWQDLLSIRDLSAGGGGKRPATVVVGHRSAGLTPAEVDLLCTGDDDAGVLNQALRRAQSVFGTLLLLPGIYEIDQTLVCDRCNLLAPGAQLRALRPLPEGILRLSDGWVNGPSLQFPENSFDPGNCCVSAGPGAELRDCRLLPGTGGIGVAANSALNTGSSERNILVSDCRVQGPPCRIGIQVTDCSLIRDNFIAGATEVGILLTGSENCLDSNTVDLKNSGSTGIGISLQGTGNSLLGNTVKNADPDKELCLSDTAALNFIVGNFARVRLAAGENWSMGNLSGNQSQGDSGGGNVQSVNGKTGKVLLGPSDVSAAPQVHGHLLTELDGVLPVTMGGTGAKNLYTARGNLGIGLRGICVTPAADTLKQVILPNFQQVELGTLILVRFHQGNTVAVPQLQVNETGAVLLNYQGRPLTPSMIPAGWEALLACTASSGDSSFPQWSLMNPCIS